MIYAHAYILTPTHAHTYTRVAYFACLRDVVLRNLASFFSLVEDDVAEEMM